MKKIILIAIVALGAGAATSRAGTFFEISIGRSGAYYSSGCSQPAYSYSYRPPCDGNGYPPAGYAYEYQAPDYGYGLHRDLHQELRAEHRDLHRELDAEHAAEHRRLADEAAAGAPWWELAWQHRLAHRELAARHWDGHDQLRDEHAAGHGELCR